jgi:PAS domain S-box-containing protein
MRIFENFICDQLKARKRAKILIVEDCKDLRSGLKDLLQSSWDVETSEDGLEALAIIERDPPDLILSDVGMPNLDGFELLKALKSNCKTKSIPFLLLSARAGEENSRIQALENGADDYIFKPFSDKELEARIHTQLKLWNARKDHEIECQKLVSIMDTVPALLSRINKNEQFTFVNKECERKLPDGQSILGQSLKSFFGPERYHKVEHHIKKVLNGESTTFEWVDSSNTIKHYYVVSCTPEFGESGEVESFISSVMNIDDRKTNEEIVEKERQRFNEFFMQAPIPMVILLGPDHRFVLANEPYQKFIGRISVGKTLLEVFSLQESENLTPLIDKVYETGEPQTGKDLPFYITDDAGEIRERFLNVSYYPFREHSEEIKGVLAIIQDMTDQVMARKLIEENEKRIQEITNTLPQMVWSADSQGALNWFNKVWYEYTGLKPGEAWDGIRTPIHPADLKNVWEEQKKAVDNGNLFQIEFRVKRKSDGMYRWHLGRGVPIRDNENEIIKWIGSSTDIHEHKMLVDQLKEERELRERFVMTLTHDLRTPLTAVKMKAELLSKKRLDPEKVKALSERIIINMDRADFMIRDLLDANRIKAGEGIPISIEECQLDVIIESVITDLVDNYGPRFCVKNKIGKVKTYWDCSAVRRVIENLVTNAIKYGKSDSSITISLKRINNWAEITVHNYGGEIRQEDLKDLFDPYRRTNSAVNSGQKGWGIGLTLVKGITEAHGGFARAESSPDQGTTFSIRLPIDARVSLQKA